MKFENEIFIKFNREKFLQKHVVKKLEQQQQQNVKTFVVQSFIESMENRLRSHKSELVRNSEQREIKKANLNVET